MSYNLTIRYSDDEDDEEEERRITSSNRRTSERRKGGTIYMTHATIPLIQIITLCNSAMMYAHDDAR